MAAKQGKVFSGEDDESDEEEEEYEPSWVTPAPKSEPPLSSSSTVFVTAPSSMKSVDESVAVEADPDAAVDEGLDAVAPAATIEPVVVVPAPVSPPPEPEDMWTAALKGEWSEADGKRKMSLAASSHLEHVLEGTMLQIAELAESQEHLLSLVMDRNVRLLSNPELAKIEQTMAQIPAYFQKVVQLKLKMNDITTNLEKLKRNADYLQVEAQSRALAKEEKKDKMSQWNKLLFAKPSSDLSAKMESNPSQ
ncbi:Aste57867_206 [Aphanomyces stellatus]|uniref:Aste57867_206 protein n=1 Tax=Aphanomyces stellatus TaxID=120398 RepID=A0A485K381_9STRA|nr:hypothetical protein As57867_000206 [Aphanomyces stellatus]VFT77432.1 Aste57867_206 [Aphanomyces stellatus]